jgi:hypothetical protein
MSFSSASRSARAIADKRSPVMSEMTPTIRSGVPSVSATMDCDRIHRISPVGGRRMRTSTLEGSPSRALLIDARALSWSSGCTISSQDDSRSSRW